MACALTNKHNFRVERAFAIRRDVSPRAPNLQRPERRKCRPVRFVARLRDAAVSTSAS